MRPRRVLHSPTVEPEPFDPAAFPGLEERRRADGGAASERWRDLIAANRTVIADGAMGTMLFANGLMFGDPPEVWNLSKPDVIRRIHRGYLDAGSQILMTNTFGGNRMRLSLHGLQDRVAELNQTAAILLRSEVDAAGGDALVAGDIGPSGAILAPTGTLDYDEAVDIFAEQAAALVAGGVDLIWIETMSDLTEIKAAIEGVRRVSPGIALITTMTFDTRGHTMMGVSPEQAIASLTAWGADAVGGNCGNGPDELITVIERMRAADPDTILVAKSNAGMPELVDMRAVYRADPRRWRRRRWRCARRAPRSSAAVAATRRSTWPRSRAASRAEAPASIATCPCTRRGRADPTPDASRSGYDTPAMTTPTPSLATPYRTHTCGQLRLDDAGTTARLAGWVHRRRDHGQLIFLDLRDRHGITQVVIDKADAPDAHATASRIRPEFVVSVAGTVAPRLPGTENAKLPTGAIELQATEVEILSEAKTPPFYINEPDATVDESLRLKYRYLDIRREPMQQRLHAPQPDGPGDPRGPSRQRLRRGRDADPDQEHARGRPRLHRAEPAPAGHASTRCHRARSSSSSC